VTARLASERATIRVDRDHRDRIPSRAEREPALARPDVGDAKSPEVQAVRA